MHAIQTSGNCVRNITDGPLARRRAPTRWSIRARSCEILRQWSTFHPEFAYLPRKFKIAVTPRRADRAASRLHDIGLDARPRPRRRARFPRAGGRRHGPHADHRAR